MSDWLPEHDAALTARIITRGISYREAATEINDRFGTDFTRNAAIGRGKRIGLCTPKRKPAPKPLRAKSKTVQRRDIARRKAASAPKAPAVPFMPRPDPRPGQVSLLELAADGCKWPSGDPALFCNEPQHPGFRYCADHCCLAYRERR